jgi:hypothetical protein
VEEVANSRRFWASVLTVAVAGLVSLNVGSFTTPAHAQNCDPGGGNNARSVEFANLGSTSVEVRWVNFQCGETLYTTVRGGASYVQQTFQSHLWRFYEVGTGRLLKEERIAAQTRIDFGDPAAAAPKPVATPSPTTATEPPTTTPANPVPVFPGAGAQKVRSPNGGQCAPGGGNQKKDVTFKNATSETIEVWWVTFDCTEKQYATMPPGSQYVQQTYVSHQWRFYEAPGGSVSKALCGATPADPQCFFFSSPSGGSALYKTDTILAATDTIEIVLPPKFDPKWKPVLKAKTSGANTVIFSWAIPAGAPGTCYSFTALVKKGTVEQLRPQACVPIPSGSASMSVSVVVDPAKVTKLRQTKAPLTYSATAALEVTEPGGRATGLPGTLVK